MLVVSMCLYMELNIFLQLVRSPKLCFSQKKSTTWLGQTSKIVKSKSKGIVKKNLSLEKLQLFCPVISSTVWHFEVKLSGMIVLPTTKADYFYCNRNCESARRNYTFRRKNPSHYSGNRQTSKIVESKSS